MSLAETFRGGLASSGASPGPSSRSCVSRLARMRSVRAAERLRTECACGGARPAPCRPCSTKPRGSPSSRTRRPTSAPSPSPSGNTALQISTPNQGDGVLFDTKQLTAAGGARVSLTYTNGSAIPHDWHLFDGPNASAPSIVSTKIEAGSNDVQHVSFTVPPNPGR
jgi:hypothetical protein